MIDTTSLIVGGVFTVLWTLVNVIAYIKRPRLPGCKVCGDVCGHSDDCIVDSGLVPCGDCWAAAKHREYGD